jgi:CheY-like chemotaxis protein
MPNTEAIWAATIADAFTFLQTHAELKLPNLISLDLYLPKAEDGWQFLETVKQDKLYLFLPIVIFSHTDLAEDIKRSYDLGCSSYVTKPQVCDDWTNYFSTLYN